jgi:hypothetical protein
MVRPTFDSGAMDSDSSVYFYETVYNISLLVNDSGHLREVVMGEEPNSYLSDLARVGFSKFGRWN